MTPGPSGRVQEEFVFEPRWRYFFSLLSVRLPAVMHTGGLNV